jgi:hypothetical protein
MAIYDPGYEVAWQLWEDDSDSDPAEASVGARPVPRESLASLARFAGLLAGAEVAAITLCRGEGLIVELTEPSSPWLAPGAFMRAKPARIAEEEWDIGALLAGRLRWCWCKPPPELCSAALVRGPWLVARQRLLLLANREGRLSEVNLGLAASYLAQAGRPTSEVDLAQDGQTDGVDRAPGPASEEE